MKQKILIKRINPNIKFPTITEKGDWVDLVAGETVSFKAPQASPRKAKTINGEKSYYRNVSFDVRNIKLGVVMRLPKGMEAHLVNRSSTGKGMGISLINGKGIIDWTYCGPDNEWRFPAIAWRNTTITEGEAFCQFRIVPSQKATMWQKLKWLLSNGIELVEVDELPEAENRSAGCVRVENANDEKK